MMVMYELHIFFKNCITCKCYIGILSFSLCCSPLGWPLRPHGPLVVYSIHVYFHSYLKILIIFGFFLAAGIREMLEKTGFFSCLDRDNLFVSVHDAVLHTQHQITSSVSEPMLNYSWTVKLLSANAKQKLILKEILKT